MPSFKIFAEFPIRALEILASGSGKTLVDEIVENSLNRFFVLLAHLKTSSWFSSVLPT
jgi:hypothetical protein